MKKGKVLQMKVTENMIAVMEGLKSVGGKGFAKDVVVKGKTFNAVNATLAACAGKGLVSKEKAVYGDKMLTCYTLTDAGEKVLVVANTPDAD